MHDIDAKFRAIVIFWVDFVLDMYQSLFLIMQGPKTERTHSSLRV